MASVVAYLYKSIESKNSARIEQLEEQIDDCEAKHAECESKHKETVCQLNAYAVQLAEVRTKLGMSHK